MTPDEQPRTVFGAPDQDEIISRLDSVDVDDEGSTFFDARSGGASAAKEAFAAGISAFGGVEASSMPEESTPEVQTSEEQTPAEPEPAAEAATGLVQGEVSLPLEDPALRAAFILGGPAALLPESQ